MTSIDKPIILIIENDHSYYNLFNQLSDDYTVIHSDNSKKGFNLAKKCHPSLIILEASLTPIGGYELCRKIKSDDYLAKVPVIFNIGSSENFDPIFILELGAIDYLVHPKDAMVDINIVRAKVHNFVHLYHSYIELENEVKLAKELNPNTSLPGNTSIVDHIYAALNEKDTLILTYADLDHFKPYNDHYGFGKGDELIQFTANVLQEAIKKVDGFKFLGHIGGDDFVFITPKKDVEDISNYIIHAFEDHMKDFYNEDDYQRGYIIGHSRQGSIVKHPLVSISMGGVDLSYYDTNTRFEEISDVCAEVKSFAKTFPGNVYKMDRRNNGQVIPLSEIG